MAPLRRPCSSLTYLATFIRWAFKPLNMPPSLQPSTRNRPPPSGRPSAHPPFIAFPGGLGTFSSLWCVSSWSLPETFMPAFPTRAFF